MKRRGFLFAVTAAPLAPAPALAQGGIVEATPALFGEIGHEVIVPKGTECMRTDTCHRWANATRLMTSGTGCRRTTQRSS
jgi:hypothetical protein